MKNKQKIFLFFCSFFVPGLGQILINQTEKGLKIMLWFYFGLPLIALICLYINIYIFLASLFFVMFCALFLWLYNILDIIRS